MKKTSRPSSSNGPWDLWAYGLAGMLLRGLWTGLWGPFLAVAAVPLAASLFKGE